MIIKWEIEKLIESVEREHRHSMAPVLFTAVVERLTAYVHEKTGSKFDFLEPCQQCGKARDLYASPLCQTCRDAR